MIRGYAALMVACLLIRAATLHAEIIPGRWEKVDALLPGTEVVITLRTGDRIRGALRSSTREDLTVAERAGSERKIPKAQVNRVLLPPEQKDSSWDGAAIGAGIGFAVGILGGGSAVKESDETIGVGALVFGPVGAGAGLLIGYILDARSPKQEVIYRAAR